MKQAPLHQFWRHDAPCELSSAACHHANRANRASDIFRGGYHSRGIPRGWGSALVFGPTPSAAESRTRRLAVLPKFGTRNTGKASLAHPFGCSVRFVITDKSIASTPRGSETATQVGRRSSRIIHAVQRRPSPCAAADPQLDLIGDEIPQDFAARSSRQSINISHHTCQFSAPCQGCGLTLPL